jgi:hypothetical protein
VYLHHSTGERIDLTIDCPILGLPWILRLIDSQAKPGSVSGASLYYYLQGRGPSGDRRIKDQHHVENGPHTTTRSSYFTDMVLEITKPDDPNGVVIEAWAQGFMVGGLIVMACVTLANMRHRVLLHKLILLELFLGMLHGTFIFTNPPVYNWYLSTTAILLNASWSLHNVIAWIKNKPFLPRWGSLVYIWSVILVQPYWVLEIVANFLYFSSQNSLFVHTRPFEALFRDPWWIFTVCSLLYNIKTRYDFGFVELIRVSPRFGILLGAMLLSICFIITDILAVTKVIGGHSLPDGINPFWKLSFVFKCLTDTIILDDFKTALDRLREHKLARLGSMPSDGLRGEFSDVVQKRKKKPDHRERHVLDISNPDEFVRKDSTHMHMSPTTNDWAMVRSRTDDLDLEAALRGVEHGGGSSKVGSRGS